MARASEEMGGVLKCPTGIKGLDEITMGGLPRGRPTLVCGGAGCGKTLMGMEFIIRGITEFGEPGVYMPFEETSEELADNVASLGMNVRELIRQNKLAIDYVHIERHQIEETGEYDLEGLFVRLAAAIDGVGAKRVVLDTVEALFAALPNPAIVRAELRRLFRWLKEKKVTAIITGEKGQNQLTRHGLEEYVSDCVIFLDHRVDGQVATRRLRIVKYRGSLHGTNEYPTFIGEEGLSILPISQIGLDYPVTNERVSTGIEALDEMFGARGYYKASSVLITGSAGTGKSSISAAFADGACRRGQKALYFSFEESPEQIVRNMASIGFDLGKWVKKGLLKFHVSRPTEYGLEAHLVRLHQAVEEFKPSAAVIDPVTSMTSMGDPQQIKAMLTRLIDYLKMQGITTVFTSLTRGGSPIEVTEAMVSSLMDTWVVLQNVGVDGERHRMIYVLKSRGMLHSSEVRRFLLTDDGIKILNAEDNEGKQNG